MREIKQISKEIFNIMFRNKKANYLLAALALITSVLVTHASPTLAAPPTWHSVGDLRFSNDWMESPSLAFAGSVTYAAYSDYGQLMVKRLNGNTWQTVGDMDSSPRYSEALYIAVDSNNNTPYIAYIDNNEGNRLTVIRLNGSIWETVGSAGFSTGRAGNYLDGNARNIALAVENGLVRVAYMDRDNDDRLTVMEFDGSSWAAIGTAYDIGSPYADPMVKFNGLMPYAAYSDSVSHRANVVRLDQDRFGWVWQIVGDPDFSSENLAGFSIAFNNSIPYVSYPDPDENFAVTVMKYDSGSWQPIGGLGSASSDNVPNAYLAVDSNDTPYLAYSDRTNNEDKLTVSRFNGSSWETVGSAGFSAGPIIFSLIITMRGDTPYVMYADHIDDPDNPGDWGKATVMRFADSDDSDSEDPVFSGNTANGVNAENGAEVSLTTPDDTDITCFNSTKESASTKQDEAYKYPLGLIEFCFDTAEQDNQISLTFVTDLKPDDVKARKYNSLEARYFEVPGAQVTQTTYQGKPALKLTYTITDNGLLDLNSAVGKITDPVGLAVPDASAPNTGLEHSSVLLNTALLITGVAGVAITTRPFIFRQKLS